MRRLLKIEGTRRHFAATLSTEDIRSRVAAPQAELGEIDSRVRDSCVQLNTVSNTGRLFPPADKHSAAGRGPHS